MSPNYSVYTHLAGTENQFQLWQAALDRSGCSSTSTVPKFIYRRWRQFCLSKLRNIPVCCLFFFCSPRLPPCILLSPSHLSHFGLWIQTDGRQTSFQTLKKVTLNRTCSPSAPGGSKTPELSWVVHFKSGEKKNIQNKDGGEVKKKNYIYFQEFE